MRRPGTIKQAAALLLLLGVGLAACEDRGLKVPGLPDAGSGTDAGTGSTTPPPEPPAEPVEPTDGGATGTTTEPGTDPVPDPGTEPGTGTDGGTGTDAGTGTAEPPVEGNTDPTPTTGTDPEPTTDPKPDPDPVPEPTPVVFRYHPAGSLTPGSGSGLSDATVHAPDMVFPIIGAPSYPQSQVYMFGGGQVGGDQCDARNYADPWRDNFCETRSSGSTPFCPRTGAHLGQDIRAGDRAGCNAMRAVSTPADRMVYRVVAVEDGTISNIGRYTVNLRAGGRIYRYLHLNMAKLDVALGDEVEAGDPIGWLSNDFGGTPTTFHLHFEIKLNTAEHGWVYVSPYMSLVRAYERMQAGAGEAISEVNVGTASVPGQP